MTFSRISWRLKTGLVQIADRASVAVRCWSLRMMNMIRGRRLEVLDIWLRDPFVIEGAPVQLVWSVKACHQIVIDDVATIAGDKTGVEFVIKPVCKPIKITFYGHRNHMQRRVAVRVVRLDLKQMSKPASATPLCSHFNPQISELAVTSISSRLPTVSELISVQIPDILMEHQPFNPINIDRRSNCNE
jgi:hypothetical protein